VIGFAGEDMSLRWCQAELTHLERNAGLFRGCLPG
jgi:hypothetical protein